jgi:hypothetical protein
MPIASGMTYREFIVEGKYLKGTFPKNTPVQDRKDEMAARMRIAAAAWKKYAHKGCVGRKRPKKKKCGKQTQRRKSRAKKSKKD